MTPNSISGQNNTLKVAIKKKQHHTRLPKRMLYILLGLTLFIAIGLIFLYPYVFSRTHSEAVIRIPANATEQNVTDTLTKYYGKKYASRIMRLAALRKVDFSKRHGLYRIEEGTNALSVMRRISYGGQTPVKLTVNGFRSLDLLCDRIASKLDFTADSLKTYLADPEHLRQYGLTPRQALALFLDDTYEVYWSASPEELINKIGQNFMNYWYQGDNSRKVAEMGITPADAMILASLADEETNAASEKGTIARLYFNRLKKGMRLQSDPTVRFALGDFTIRRVKGEHLKVNSPYNTYQHAGLPPGPIRTTSRATLDSFLSSPPNDYLYMCAKEDFSGTHNFATNFAEHSLNAKRYRQALDQRGIK